MTLKTDAKLEGRLTRASQNDIRNSGSFHRLKNIDFILKSKSAEVNQNKNSKQLDRPDAVRKLKIEQLTKLFTHVLQNRRS